MSDSEGEVVEQVDLIQYQNHIESVCNAVGGWVKSADLDDVFVLGDEALGCLKDIKRFLRYDESNKTRHCHLAIGKSRLVPQALIPILQNHQHKTKLIGAVVELLTPLTWPLEILSEADYVELAPQVDYLQEYKEAFLQPGALSGVLNLVVSLMQVEYRDRKERDNGLIRLSLLLFRNLLSIPDAPTSSTSAAISTAKRATMQERLLVQFDQEDILGLLLALAGSAHEHQYADFRLTLLHIFCLIFEQRDASALYWGLEYPEKLTFEQAPQPGVAKELKRKKLLQERISTRHSRFGGTTTMQFNDGNRINVHSQNAALMSLDTVLDTRKKQLPYRRKPVISTTELCRQVSLQQAFPVFQKVATTLISHCFSPLIASLKREIELESGAILSDDVTRFFEFVSFLLEYQRLAYVNATNEEQRLLFDFDSIACLFNVKGLLFIIRHMRDALESKLHAKLFASANCLRHFLSSLLVLSPDFQGERGFAAQNMLSNLYYEKTHADLLLQLVKVPNEKLRSREFVTTTVHLVFIFLKLLERYSTLKTSIFMRRRKTVRKKASQSKKAEPPSDLQQSDESTLQVIEGQTHGSALDKATPNGASGSFAAENFLPTSTPSIFTEVVDQVLKKMEEAIDQTLESKFTSLCVESDETMRDAPDDYVEEKLVFEDIEEQFCVERVLDTHFYLLGYYETLSEETALAIVNFFYRVYVRQKRPAAFCRVSYIYLLRKILRDRLKLELSGRPFRELFNFMEKLSASIVDMSKTCPTLFIAMFYPKSRHDMLRIQLGEDIYAMAETEKKSPQLDLENVTIEYRVKPGLTWSQQVGVLVGVLQSNGFDFAPVLEFFKEAASLRKLAENRSVVVKRLEMRSKRVEDGLPAMQLADFESPDAALPTHYLGIDMDREREILASFDPVKDLDLIRVEPVRVQRDSELYSKLGSIQVLRELFATLGVTSSEKSKSSESQWSIDKELTGDQVDNWTSTIEHFLLNPLTVDGKPVHKLLRRRKRRNKAQKDGKSVKCREKAPQVILSAQFLNSEDDVSDDENSKEFYEREAAQRLRNEALANSVLQSIGNTRSPAEREKATGASCSGSATDEDISSSSDTETDSDETSDSDDEDDVYGARNSFNSQESDQAPIRSSKLEESDDNVGNRRIAATENGIDFFNDDEFNALFEKREVSQKNELYSGKKRQPPTIADDGDLGDENVVYGDSATKRFKKLQD